MSRKSNSRPVIVAILLGWILGTLGWGSLSKAAGVSIEAYGQLPLFEQIATSPNGKRIAVAGLINGVHAVTIADADNKPEQTLAIGDTKLVGLYWAGSDLLLIRYRNTAALGIGFTAAKTELETMLVVPMDGGAVHDVFSKNRFITGGIRGYYGLNERNGKWYGYFGGITLERSKSYSDGILTTTQPDLYEVELASGKTRRIANHIDTDDGWRDWIVSPEGEVAASLDFLSKDGTWRLRNREQKVIQSGSNPQGLVGLLGFGYSTDEIFYSVQDEKTGRIGYYKVMQSGADATEILPDISVATLIHDPYSRIMIGYVTDEDFPQTVFYNEVRSQTMAVMHKSFPGKRITLDGWSHDFTKLVLHTEGAQDPGTWWTIDVKAGKAGALGSSYKIPASQVAPYRMVKYQAEDGTEIEGVLTTPPNKTAVNLPAIVLPHGGPAARDYPEFDWWVQAFAAQGYAVFQPNFRGSTGYGTAFREAGHGEWGRKMQTDISDGLQVLVKQGIVDPKRVCIMGASYGGYAALAGVTLQHGFYRCAVSVAGIGDVGAMYLQDVKESGRDQTLIRALKTTLGNYRDFKDISPINFVDRADAPILLIHGKDDTVVDYSQSKDMEKALRKAGKTVQLVTLDGEDHRLSKSATRLQMLKAASEFIHKYNPPD